MHFPTFTEDSCRLCAVCSSGNVYMLNGGAVSQSRCGVTRGTLLGLQDLAKIASKPVRVSVRASIINIDILFLIMILMYQK